MNHDVLRVGVEVDLDTRIPRASLAWLGRVFIDLGDGRRLRAQEPAFGGSFGVFLGTRRVSREEIEQKVPHGVGQGRAARQIRDLLAREGVALDDETLRGLPFEVEFCDQLLSALERPLA